MKTTLRGILDIDASDFGLDSLAYQMLVRAYKMGEQVEVLGIACVGDTHLHSYFDIQLSNGLKIDAIAGTHLVDIDRFGTNEVLHCQLVVDVQYFREGNAVVNHSVLEDLISQAAYNTLKTSAATDLRLKHIDVTFETEFNTSS